MGYQPIISLNFAEPCMKMKKFRQGAHLRNLSTEHTILPNVPELHEIEKILVRGGRAPGHLLDSIMSMLADVKIWGRTRERNGQQRIQEKGIRVG